MEPNEKALPIADVRMALATVRDTEENLAHRHGSYHFAIHEVE
jgi:hypothetical protein